MKQKNKKSFLTLLCVTLLALLLTSCGYKTNPIPPQEVVPEAVSDLRYQLIDGGVRLFWSYPVKTIQGKDITSVSNFELYRAGVAPKNYCPTCPVPFGAPQRLPGGSVLDGSKRRTASYDVQGLTPSYKYFFKIVSRTGWWASSKTSNVITFTYSMPPAAPKGLYIQPGDNTVYLTWNPVTTLKNGQSLSGSVRYEVLRNGTKIADSITSPKYTDRDVKNGQHYRYSVRASLVENTTKESVVGESSAIAKIAPTDTTPPKVIKGVRAVAVYNGITIFWNSSEENNLKGYRIYRRESTSKKYKLIADIKPQYTVYTDTSVNDSSSRFYYVITAIDANDNESNYSASTTPR